MAPPTSSVESDDGPIASRKGRQHKQTAASLPPSVTFQLAEDARLVQHRDDTAAPPSSTLPRVSCTLWDDSAIAFEMLDKDKDGFLSPGDARYWLRCVGWCCTDKELGVALKGTTGQVAKSKFSLQDLTLIAATGSVSSTTITNEDVEVAEQVLEPEPDGTSSAAASGAVPAACVENVEGDAHDMIPAGDFLEDEGRTRMTQSEHGTGADVGSPLLDLAPAPGAADQIEAPPAVVAPDHAGDGALEEVLDHASASCDDANKCSAPDGEVDGQARESLQTTDRVNNDVLSDGEQGDGKENGSCTTASGEDQARRVAGACESTSASASTPARNSGCSASGGSASGGRENAREAPPPADTDTSQHQPTVSVKLCEGEGSSPEQQQPSSPASARPGPLVPHDEVVPTTTAATVADPSSAASKPSTACVKAQKLKDPDQHLASVPRLLDLLSSVTRGKLELDAATFYELMSTEGEPLGLEDLEELMGVIGFGANRLGGNLIDIRSLADTLVSKILVPPCVPTQRSKYAA